MKLRLGKEFQIAGDEVTDRRVLGFSNTSIAQGNIIHSIHLSSVIGDIIFPNGIEFSDYIVPVACTQICPRGRKKRSNIVIDLIYAAGVWSWGYSWR